MKIRAIYIGLLMLTAADLSFAQWVQTDGPYSDIKITSIFTNDNRIFASTPCGLHTTNDLSKRWDLKSTLRIETYVKKDNLIYFGGKNSGFQLLDLSEPGLTPVSHGRDGVTVITIKDGGTCLFASIEEEGFFKSTGYTEEWVQFNRGLPAIPRQMNPGVKYIYQVNSIEKFDTTLFVATHKGIYKADMNNIVWYSSSEGLPEENIQQIKLINETLYATVANTLYSSDNRGDSWNLLYAAGSDIASVNSINNRLYITTHGSGIYVSTDNGTTWNTLNNGLGDQDVNIITNLGSTLICGTNTQGVYFYDGSSWINDSKGIICSDIWSMAKTKNSIAASDETNVYVATGQINTWKNTTPSVNKNYFGSLATMDNLVFLAYKNNPDQLIKYTTSGQDNWKDLNSPVPYKGQDTYKMLVKGKTLYVYEDNHLYSSDDMGSTWGDHSLSAAWCNEISDVVIFNNTLFASTCGDGELLRLSADNQWELANNGLPAGKPVTSLAHSAEALYAHVLNEGIYVSKDNGSTWTKANNGFYSDWEIRSFAYLDNNIFISSAKGVFYSTDFGENWHLMNEGLKNPEVGPLVIYKDTLYVGSHGNGIWKYGLTEFIPIEEDTTPVIQTIKIFPNPATQYVRFDFKDLSNAQIRIIDILGRERLFTKLEADRQIDVSRLVNGTYVIIISTDSFVYNSKLVIARQ